MDVDRGQFVGFKWLYAPVLRLAIRFPLPLEAASVAVFGLGLLVASGFGLEFVPKLDEGDIAIQAVRLPSVSLETSIEMTTAMKRTLFEFPEVESVVSTTGRPEIANDPMGVHQTDVLVRLPPGYVLEWGGQFENLELARRRLLVAVPVALLLIFSLLSMTFGSVSLTMLISLKRR